MCDFMEYACGLYVQGGIKHTSIWISNNLPSSFVWSRAYVSCQYSGACGHPQMYVHLYAFVLFVCFVYVCTNKQAFVHGEGGGENVGLNRVRVT